MPIAWMRNHFHLVMETPQPNLVAGMQWFLGYLYRAVPAVGTSFLAICSADATNP